MSCPYCKAPSFRESQWEVTYRCGTDQPIDGPTSRSKLCKEREAEQKAEASSTEQ